MEFFKDNELFRQILENYYMEVTLALKVEEFDVMGHIGFSEGILVMIFLWEKLRQTGLTRWKQSWQKPVQIQVK